MHLCSISMYIIAWLVRLDFCMWFCCCFNLLFQRVPATLIKINKKFKPAYLNFNNNYILTEILPSQNLKIWCKHIYPSRQFMLNYIIEHQLSGWVNVYHAWQKNIVSLQVRSLSPIILSFHLRLPETEYIYSSASFLVTVWWQHFGFKIILRTSIELLLHAECYCKHILVFLL